MLFLIIPLSLILGSILAIAIIVGRKSQYIKKLAIADMSAQAEGVAQSGVSSKNFTVRLFSELAPEMVGSFKKLKFYEYREAWLMELEKFLRRLRLLSLRIDRMSDSLISKIRKGYQNGHPAALDAPHESSSALIPTIQVKTVPAPIVNDLEALRKEEQRLIIEIAKNPKDAGLYDTLGDLYIKMGEYTDAKESFEAAMELDPSNQDLKKKHSYALEKLQRAQTK